MEELGVLAGPGDHLLRLKQKFRNAKEHSYTSDQSCITPAHDADHRSGLSPPASPITPELLALQEQIVQSTVEIHGWLDKRSVAAVANFAVLLRRANSPRAINTYASALEHSASFHGLAHPSTLLVAKEYIDCLMDMGKFEVAELVTKDILKAIKQRKEDAALSSSAAGAANTSALLLEYWRFSCTLVNILYASGNKSRCLAVLQTLIDSYERIVGLPSFAPLVASMTRILIKLSRYETACGILEDLIEVQQRTALPQGKPSILLAHNCADLALCHVKMESRVKYPAAKALMETALTILSHHKKAAGSRSLYEAYMLYSDILRLLGKSSEATIAREKASQILRGTNPRQHKHEVFPVRVYSDSTARADKSSSSACARRQRVVRAPLGTLDMNRSLTTLSCDLYGSCTSSRLASVSSSSSAASSAASSTRSLYSAAHANLHAPLNAGNFYDTTGMPRSTEPLESEYDLPDDHATRQIPVFGEWPHAKQQQPRSGHEGSRQQAHAKVAHSQEDNILSDKDQNYLYDIAQQGAKSLDHTYVFVSPPRNLPPASRESRQSAAIASRSSATSRGAGQESDVVIVTKQEQHQRVAQNAVYEHDYLPMTQVVNQRDIPKGTARKHDEPIYDVLHLSLCSDADAEDADPARPFLRAESPIYEIVAGDEEAAALDDLRARRKPPALPPCRRASRKSGELNNDKDELVD